MGKTFRQWNPDQSWLLPPSVHDFVPESHPAHFIRETVREDLDLNAILKAYSEERGFPPYHPVMMTALLLYAYTRGIFSSRRIAKGCEERVDFMAVTGLQKPDFRTINDFRLRHLGALAGLFDQVLELCQKAGLVKLGHVAVDGTKIKANASKHKAMSYSRMLKQERQFEALIQGWMDQAAAEDAAEDELYGKDKRGDELPEWVADRRKRREKIRQAKAELEAEARAEAEARNKLERGEKKKAGKRKHKADGTPNPKSQRNFTDPQSRLLKTSDGFIQGYNAQAAVDSHAQIIVARALSNEQNDAPMLESLVKQIRSNTGGQAKELSADTGYCSEHNLAVLKRRKIRGYIAQFRQKHGADSGQDRRRELSTSDLAVEMRRRIARAGFRSRYRLRKQIVEPVFGQIKAAMGFSRFLLRGLAKVRSEWDLIAIAHNLRKLTAFSTT